MKTTTTNNPKMTYGHDTYTAIYADQPDVIGFQVNDETPRYYKVKRDGEFVFKFQKTQVKAIDGAEGLFDYLHETFEGDNGCSVNWVTGCIRWFWDNGRPLKNYVAA